MHSFNIFSATPPPKTSFEYLGASGPPSFSLRPLLSYSNSSFHGGGHQDRTLGAGKMAAFVVFFNQR